MMATQTTHQQTTTPPLARTKQVLEHFQISHMTLYRWEKQTGFPKPLRRGQVKLFSIAAIEQWMMQDVEGL